MPSPLALVLALGFIGFLFRRDFRQRPNVTSAIWIPIIWMFLTASKPVSIWLSILGLPVTAASGEEGGSPIDVLVFLGLMMAGVRVLGQRRVSLAEVLRDNPWITVFVAYCLISILWSDFPFTAFKRWIKVLGHPIIVLVLFTEPELNQALLTMMKRCAYVLFPISILWLKYFPELGRKWDEYGIMTNCGISTGKNAMGNMCAVFGLFFLWYLLQLLRKPKSTSRKKELQLIFGLLLMIGYCLLKAHSATSDICFALGAGIIVVLGLRSLNKRAIALYAAATVVLLVIAQLSFDIYGKVVAMTGHNSTIEGREVLWEQLLTFGTNPFFGVGFESFWLGPRLDQLHEGRPWQPNEAHNGYIEIYLNLGIFGLLLLAGMIFATFRKIRLDLLTDFEWGRFQMACLIALLAHSWTEAGFRGLSFPFFIFFIIAMNYPRRRILGAQQAIEPSWYQRGDFVATSRGV